MLLDDLPACDGFRLRLLREDDLEDMVRSLGLTVIEALIEEANAASRRAAERGGFVATGERRMCMRGGCAVKDVPPHLVYRVPTSAA